MGGRHMWSVKKIKVGRGVERPLFYQKASGTFIAAVKCIECGEERQKELNEQEAKAFKRKYYL